MLPVLYIAQDEYGHLTDAAIREVAQILDLPPTDVFEVVGFYTLFYSKPVGKWVLQVCDDVPCRFLGAEQIVDHLEATLGIKANQTTADGMFTLQRVKCLADCDRAPLLQAGTSTTTAISRPKRLTPCSPELRQRADAGQPAERLGAASRALRAALLENIAGSKQPGFGQKPGCFFAYALVSQ